MIPNEGMHFVFHTVRSLDRFAAMLRVKRWQDLSKEERRAALLDEALYGILIAICAALALSGASALGWVMHHYSL